MQTVASTAAIMSAADRVAWAVKEVSRGFKAGDWSIREGCRRMKVHPQTYYKHRLKQNEQKGGDASIAATAPFVSSVDQDETQTVQDNTSGAVA